MSEIANITTELGLSEAGEQKNGSLWFIPASLDVRLMAAVLRSHGARFVTLAAMQLDGDDEFRLEYHWDLNGQLVSFVTKTKQKRIPTIVDLCQAADWIERETHESFAIDFVGHGYEPLLLRAGDATLGLNLRKEPR